VAAKIVIRIHAQGPVSIGARAGAAWSPKPQPTGSTPVAGATFFWTFTQDAPLREAQWRISAETTCSAAAVAPTTAGGQGSRRDRSSFGRAAFSSSPVPSPGSQITGAYGERGVIQITVRRTACAAPRDDFNGFLSAMGRRGNQLRRQFPLVRPSHRRAGEQALPDDGVHTPLPSTTWVTPKSTATEDSEIAASAPSARSCSRRHFSARAVPRVMSSQVASARSTTRWTSSFKRYPACTSFVAASVTSAA
jgi:hypothetical protein